MPTLPQAMTARVIASLSAFVRSRCLGSGAGEGDAGRVGVGGGEPDGYRINGFSHK